jgi:hypothetical protein
MRNPIKTHTLAMQINVRTYVFLSGCTAPLGEPWLGVFSFACNFSSPDVDTEVEKCFEDAARGRLDVDGVVLCGGGALTTDEAAV